jgi:hypothetical protein
MAAGIRARHPGHEMPLIFFDEGGVPSGTVRHKGCDGAVAVAEGMDGGSAGQAGPVVLLGCHCESPLATSVAIVIFLFRYLS